MASFYRGAGIGTFWHKNDARTCGFTAQSPGNARSLATLINHIKDGTTNSPYVSLTRSYSVAWTYAVYCGCEVPGDANPAYVYEVEITRPPPKGLTIIDPACEILVKSGAGDPLTGLPYQHNGFPDFLAGVIDPRSMRDHLLKTIGQPPPGGGTPRAALLTNELETIVRALRDAELLAIGTLPSSCVINRYPVYRL